MHSQEGLFPFFVEIYNFKELLSVLFHSVPILLVLGELDITLTLFCRYADAIRTLKILLSKVASGRRRGYWTLRLSIDLEHMGRPNESLSIAEGGVTDPWIRAGPKIALQKRVLRLGKPPRRWKVPSYADSLKRNIKEVNIALMVSQEKVFCVSLSTGLRW